MCLAGAAHFNRVSISVAGSEKIIDKQSASSEKPSLIPSSSIGETHMGTVYTSFLVFYMCFMIPGGWLIDRIGPKWSLAVMCLGSAVFTVLTGIAGLVWNTPLSLWVGLLAVRSVMGVTNAPLHPASARLVSDSIPPSAVSIANGMVTFGACLGMGFVYVAFGALIDVVGWPVAFLVTGGITFLLACVWIVTVREARSVDREPTNSKAAEADSLFQLLKDRSLLCLTLSYTAVGYFQYLFFYWMEYYFETVLEFNKVQSRWLSTAMVVSMGIGMVAFGRLADQCKSKGGKRAYRIVPVACLAVSSIVVILSIESADYRAKIPFLLIAMAAVGGTEGSYWTHAVGLGRTRGGTSAAIMNTGGNIGGLLAPFVSPYIAVYLSWDSVLRTASGVCVVGAILWFLIDSHGSGFSAQKCELPSK